MAKFAASVLRLRRPDLLFQREVAQVETEVVGFDSASGQAEGLDYARLTALLIEAVKDQQRRLDALRAENAELQA